MMTSAEVTAARERLGLSSDAMSAEFGMTPAIVSGWERGTVRVPTDVERMIRWRLAVAERDALLDASGLPSCAEAEAIDENATGKGGEQLLAILEQLERHGETCPVCRARAEFLERHAPPLPEFPMPRWIRAIGAITHLADRLPAPLRPPEGDAGNGRRSALGLASGFSLLALGIFALAGGAHLVARRFEARWWTDSLLTIAAVIPAYFIGFYLAGAAFDVTRPIRHRLIGYVVRGALGAAAVYGTIVVVLWVTGEATYSDIPGILAIMGGVGAVAGAVLWAAHRIRGKVPTPVA